MDCSTHEKEKTIDAWERGAGKCAVLRKKRIYAQRMRNICAVHERRTVGIFYEPGVGIEEKRVSMHASTRKGKEQRNVERRG